MELVDVALLPQPHEVTYIVAAGDTLGGIAATFGTTVVTLAELNGIANAHAIAVGQIIRIPLPPRSPLLPDAPQRSRLEGVDLVQVIDGDSIVTRFQDGSIHGVRYIGINAPELREPFGADAPAQNAELLGGAVFLEGDVEDRDRLGRLLRHVWVEDETGALLLINAALVSLGFAQVSTLPPDGKYADLYRAAQEAAEAARAGMWGGGPPLEGGDTS